MNFANCISSAKKLGAKFLFACRKKSPELLLIGSAVTGVGALYFAVQAGRQVDSIVAETHAELDAVEKNPQSTKKDYIKAYARSGLRFGKVFGPAVALEGASLFMGHKSYTVIKNRLDTETRMRIAADSAMAAVKKKAVDVLGEEEARKIFYEEQKTVTDNGGDTETEETSYKNLTRGPGDPRIAAWNRDTAPTHWSKTPVVIYDSLQLWEQQANQRLQYSDNGIMSLAEVKQFIGLTPEKRDYSILWNLNKDPNLRVNFGFEYDMYPNWRTDDQLVVKNVELYFNCNDVV